MLLGVHLSSSLASCSSLCSSLSSARSCSSSLVFLRLHSLTSAETRLDIYTYLYISTRIYTYLHVSTHIYTYLHVSTRIYTADPHQFSMCPGGHLHASDNSGQRSCFYLVVCGNGALELIIKEIIRYNIYLMSLAMVTCSSVIPFSLCLSRASVNSSG